MKSIHHGTAAANSKLRGKRSKLLTCKCCSLYNFKHDERVKEAKNLIKEFKNGID
jgi:hypothetical protein